MQNFNPNTKIISAILIVIISLFTIKTYAVQQTVGILQNSEYAYQGYSLFCPSYSYTTYLIDNYGREVHSWRSEYLIDKSCYLLDNGNLLRTFRTSGRETGIQEFTWEGNLIWEYYYSGENYLRHHDIEPLPNGNVLILARENKTQEEAFQAGRNPDKLTTNILFTEYIVEVSPTGLNTADIIWEWHLWDHLIQDFDSNMDNHGVVADHPELLDINFTYTTIRSWIHANSVDYNTEFDQIMISSRNLSEIWIIDHSTTSQEAASHFGGTNAKGGDFLYRWGNPQAYRAGSEIDRKYYVQHDARWIESDGSDAGNILVFNNGDGRPGGSYSSIDEIIPPVDENGIYTQPLNNSAFMPVTQEWIYSGADNFSFYSDKISGAHRLSNGNTLICVGFSGHFVEVSDSNEMVWEYINPVTSNGSSNQGETAPNIINSAFRCFKYSPDYGVLPEKELLPVGYLEINPITFCQTVHSPKNPTSQDTVIITSKVADESGINSVKLITYIENDSTMVEMFDDGLLADEIAGDSIYTTVILPQDMNTTVSYYLLAEDGSMSFVNDPPFASNTYNFKYTVGEEGTLEHVQNVNINIENNRIVLTWDRVAGATSYHVYSSDNPDNNFILLDTITDCTWNDNIRYRRKFYQITATNDEMLIQADIE